MIINQTVGGTALNFRVVGGTTEPTNPKENDIWVNTAAEITDWIFSAVQPTTRADGTALSGGEVFIRVDTSNNINFNALKRKALFTYPANVQQYTGSLWAGKSALIYQSGQWKELSSYLYDEGAEFAGLTGGWAYNGYTYVTGTKNTDSLSLSVSDANQHGLGSFSTVNKIDLTDVNSLVFTYMKPASTYIDERVGIMAANSTTTVLNEFTAGLVAYSALPDSAATSGQISVDVSGIVGSYFVVIGISNRSPSSTGRALTVYQVNREY